MNDKLRELVALRAGMGAQLDKAARAGALRAWILGLNFKRLLRDVEQLRERIEHQEDELERHKTHVHEEGNRVQSMEAQTAEACAQAGRQLAHLGVSAREAEDRHAFLKERKNWIPLRIEEINANLEEIEKRVLFDARLVATTLTKTFSARQLPDAPFDVLVLDEASMAPLPHLFWASGRCRDFVTVVGDFLQLPPICISREPMAQKWLGRSVFEVLGVHDVKGASKDSRVRLLDTQYRMNPAISAIPNRLFYGGVLKDAEVTSVPSVNDGVSGSPLVLVETGGIGAWCSRLTGGSRFNLYHAVLAVTLARKMTAGLARLREKEGNGDARIGIIAPYGAQARLIDKIAQDWDMSDHVRVSTVHRFQGGEEPFIVFDSVEGLGTRVAPMLSGSQADSDPTRLLNVAITRSRQRFYFIGNTTHLISSLKSDAVLARIVEHLLQAAQIIPSESLVDPYFCSDFERWADALLVDSGPIRKPIPVDQYTERDFWPQFIEDFRAAQKRVFIYSPFLTVKRVAKFMDTLRSKAANGVEIHVHTWPSNRQQGVMAEQSRIAVGSLRGIGVRVIEEYHTSRRHFKTAIIDDRILWDGSLNILSHSGTGEHMWRVEGESSVKEVLKNLELEDELPSGFQSPEMCVNPDCGGYLIVRSKFGRKFWGCSNFATKGCRFTRPIQGGSTSKRGGKR
ncbi:MAG: AAA domain-containing protein [Candidatus Zixiibacteriota bacterium]